ncbi:MAG: hypothetical protein GY858_06075 [Candidatus Omnitrophica bacterium]|nr:hypothetical protein [Candidatus Omnitrophota bacterium]
MLLRKKAQSTAEYAITIGLVVAVAAGIMQVALKNGMRQKSKEANDILRRAGTAAMGSMDVDTTIFGGASTGLNPDAQGAFNVYNESARSTVVDQESYLDKTILEKGGAEKKLQHRETVTTSMDVDNFENVNKDTTP